MLVVDKLIFSKFEHNLTLILKVSITEREFLEIQKTNNCEYYLTQKVLANKQKIPPVKKVPVLPLDEEFVYIEKIEKEIFYFKLTLR